MSTAQKDATSVHVELWIGSASHSRAKASVDVATDVLTVTDIDNPRYVDTYDPGFWVRATVRTDGGEILYELLAQTPTKQIEPWYLEALKR